MKLTASALLAARGGETVVGPVDFVLSAGEALVVTGENGSGKSTLLRAVAGLLPLAGGTVAIFGESDRDGEPASGVAEAAHYLGHRNAMKAVASVGESLRFWAAFLGGGGIPAEDALVAVGLAGVANLPFSYLSAGQQRRAAIARLLVAHRPIWLLDEPTAALDAAAQGMVADILRRHLGGGGLLLAATHQPLGLDARELRLEARRSETPNGPARGGRADADVWT